MDASTALELGNKIRELIQSYSVSELNVVKGRLVFYDKRGKPLNSVPSQ